MASIVALLPTILAIGAGLIIGLVKGGSVDNLIQWRPASAEVAAAGLFAMFLSDVIPTNNLIVSLLLYVALFSLLYAAWMNRRVGGMVVVAVGLFLNLAAAFPNGGTPVSADALVSSGIVEKSELSKIELTGSRVVRSDDTLFGFLGDSIVIPGPSIVSIGDIITWIGLALATQSIVRRRQVRVGHDTKPRRNPVNTPATYQEALSTLGMGPAHNPLESAQPAGTGHPQSGMVKRLPPAPQSGAARAAAPPLGPIGPIGPNAPEGIDDMESVVRILPGPPSHLSTPSADQPADDAPIIEDPLDLGSASVNSAATPSGVALGSDITADPDALDNVAALNPPSGMLGGGLQPIIADPSDQFDEAADAHEGVRLVRIDHLDTTPEPTPYARAGDNDLPDDNDPTPPRLTQFSLGPLDDVEGVTLLPMSPPAPLESPDPPTEATAAIAPTSSHDMDATDTVNVTVIDESAPTAVLPPVILEHADTGLDTELDPPTSEFKVIRRVQRPKGLKQRRRDK